LYLSGAVKGTGNAILLTYFTGVTAKSNELCLNMGNGVLGCLANGGNTATGLTTDSSRSSIIVERNTSKYLFFFIN